MSEATITARTASSLPDRVRLRNRRNAADFRLRAYGIAAISTAVGLLGILLFTLVLGGYSAFVQCRDCGDVATCPNCSISLTLHRTPERLVCHYCLHREDPRPSCRRCKGATLRQRGMGTQQVERLLAERFPTARLARMELRVGGSDGGEASGPNSR